MNTPFHQHPQRTEDIMSVIGTFTPAKDGGWDGSIHTLTINTKVRLIPNDNRENENAPAFLIFSGRSELGAAWKQRSSPAHSRCRHRTR
jgi:uncharacterized protein (DUF736 family)